MKKSKNDTKKEKDNKSSKNESTAKKIVKKMAKSITKILKPILVFLILIIIAGAFLVGIIEKVAETIGEAVSTVGDFFTSTVDENDGRILVEDEQIDVLLNSIYETGVDPESLGLLGELNKDGGVTNEEYREALRKYIREFYEAQVMTETLNYKHIESTDNATYGAVYVFRAEGDNASENRRKLTYIPYDDMLEYVESGNADAINYFSVNEEKSLVVVGTTQTIEESGSSEENLIETSNQTAVTLRTLDYKTAISQYTTQMTFLIDLVMITDNPEFVSALVDLIKDSRIEITVMDTVSTNEYTETYTYTPMRKWTESTVEVNSTDVQEEQKREAGTPVTEVTKTTKITTTPSFNITSVKTWFSEQEITYNKITDGPTTSGPDTTRLENESEPPGNEGEWKTNQTITTKTTTTTEKYEESIRGDVTFTVGEKGDGRKYERGELENPTFVGLMETGFKIPNSEIYEEAGIDLVSGAELLFELLQQDPKLQNMETIMRYALYKYSGRNYGVTELDGSIYNIEEFSSIGGGSASQLLREYIREWEFGNNALTNKDGTKYIIVDDGYGNLAVGYGIDIYNGGYADLFLAAGYKIEAGAEVDVEFVDALEEQTINNMTESVKAITSGLDLTEYQLAALISRSYDCGVSGALNNSFGSPARDFVDSYIAYWNQEEDDQFEERDSNADFNHSLYTQYMSKMVYASGSYSQGLARRRRSEWTLFQTGYYDVIGKWHSAGGGVTTDEEAQALQEQIENEWINTKYHHGNSAYQSGPFAKWWTSPINILQPFQCTWWANGRASKYLEEYGTGEYTQYPTQYGDGKDYYFVNLANGWFESGSTPRANSIVSWTHGEYGHVAYVEGVGSDGIYISHAGGGESWFGVQKIPLDGSIWDYGTPDGYIYLDSPL